MLVSLQDGSFNTGRVKIAYEANRNSSRSKIGTARCTASAREVSSARSPSPKWTNEDELAVLTNTVFTRTFLHCTLT